MQDAAAPGMHSAAGLGLMGTDIKGKTVMSLLLIFVTQASMLLQKVQTAVMALPFQTRTVLV